MSKYLQVRVEFPSGESHGVLPQELSDSVRSIFHEAGIEDSVVTAGVEDVRVSSPLAIDPGTAAVLVALIGVSIELIKLGVDSMKQEDELELKRQELELKRDELELKEKEIEAQRTRTGAHESRERALAQHFVEELLLPRLSERHNIRPTVVVVESEEH